MDDVLDPDSAMTYLRDWQGRVDRMAADTQAMSDRLHQLRVTAQDDNHIAEVTIDSTGALIDVRFTERLPRFGPEAVSRAVMSAVHQAKKTAAVRSREIVTETMGDQSVAGRTIADRLEHQLLGGSDD
jgi:DNA-binding protein YbaB